MIKDFKFVSNHNKREAMDDFYWGLGIIVAGIAISVILFMTRPALISTLIESIVASIVFGLATMWTLINDSADFIKLSK